MIIREIFAKLGIQVDGKSSQRANRILEGFKARLGQLSRSSDNMFAGFRRGLLQIAGLTAALRGANFVGQTIMETERLRAVLETIEGGAENAAQAFDFLSRFAARTPFTINQNTEAWIRLRGAGLEPTEEQLTNLGNVAATFQSDLASLVEAAQGAGRGMPRLLEGILRSDVAVSGDRLRLTFQGVQHDIGRSTEEVLAFLETLGADQFAGAMDRQMNSILGRLSNLGDAVTAFIRIMADAGLTDALTDLFGELGRITNESEGLANQLGGTLAGAVRRLTELIVFLHENADTVRRVFMLLGGFAVSRSIMTLGVTLGRAMRTALGPANLLITALMAIPLVITDIIAFMRGEDSMIERWLGDKDTIGETRDAMNNAFDMLVESLSTLTSAFGRLFESIFGGISGAEALEVVLAGIAAAMETIARLADEVSDFLNDFRAGDVQGVRESFATEFGASARRPGESGEAFAARAREEIERWQRTIRSPDGQMRVMQNLRRILDEGEAAGPFGTMQSRILGAGIDRDTINQEIERIEINIERREGDPPLDEARLGVVMRNAFSDVAQELRAASRSQRQ